MTGVGAHRPTRWGAWLGRKRNGRSGVSNGNKQTFAPALEPDSLKLTRNMGSGTGTFLVQDAGWIGGGAEGKDRRGPLGCWCARCINYGNDFRPQ
jgi:hypothetical protein